MTWLGLVGGPLIIVSGTAVMVAGDHPSGALHAFQAVTTAPEFLWELALGIYCVTKGFQTTSAILRDDSREDRVAAMPVVAPA